MLVTTYVLIVLTITGGSPNVEMIEFKSADECFSAEFTVENTTGAFAKCVKRQKEQI